MDTRVWYVSVIRAACMLKCGSNLRLRENTADVKCRHCATEEMHPGSSPFREPESKNIYPVSRTFLSLFLSL